MISPDYIWDAANEVCTVERILQYAKINDLVITTNEEFVRTCIAIFIIGAVVGVIVWEFGKFMYHYGKRKAAERESESG